MITVKFVGGAKKLFNTELIDVDKSDITIQTLLDYLISIKPENSPELDTENILIAINGADSSSMNGKSTMIKTNDLVSIIPIIHGGSSQKLVFEFMKKQILTMKICGTKDVDVKFLDKLRTKYPTTKIQAISSKFILNNYHLEKILSLSLTAQKEKTLLSNKLETDILMRFALSSQISKAITDVGIKPKNNFFLICIGSKQNLTKIYDELSLVSTSLFSSDNSTFLKKHYRIRKIELDSVYSKYPLEDLLVEKATVLF